MHQTERKGDELKPCPCGNPKAIEFTYERSRDFPVRIACSRDECRWTVIAESREEARAIWNRREPPRATKTILNVFVGKLANMNDEYGESMPIGSNVTATIPVDIVRRITAEWY